MHFLATRTPIFANTVNFIWISAVVTARMQKTMRDLPYQDDVGEGHFCFNFFRASIDTNEAELKSF